MTPSAWIAFASLAAVLFVNIAVVSFMLGRLFQRVTHVERGLEDRSELNDKVTALCIHQENNAKAMEKVGRELEGVHRQLGNIAMGHVGKGGEMI